MAKTGIKAGILGASGYTGADLVRLAACHPQLELAVLTANAHAGKPMRAVFPHLGNLALPDLIKVEEANWSDLDVVFCGLPHGTTQEIIAALPPSLRVVDMSADFRLRNIETYAQWYGHEHRAPDLQKDAVYGLSEHYRDEIRGARLVACPGCYPTAALLLLIPLLKAGVISAEDLIIDAKSGVSGAGRAPKENTLFCEAGEGLSPYAIASHRHAPEIEQELSVAANTDVAVNFTPHLIPMSRGELLTVYARLEGGANAEAVRAVLQDRYGDEPFVWLAEPGEVPKTQNVRGSNFCQIGVFQDRLPGRVILVSTLDNQVKGSSGQALQNMNQLVGLDETAGLQQQPLFP